MIYLSRKRGINVTLVVFYYIFKILHILTLACSYFSKKQHYDLTFTNSLRGNINNAAESRNYVKFSPLKRSYFNFPSFLSGLCMQYIKQRSHFCGLSIHLSVHHTFILFNTTLELQMWTLALLP